MAIVVTAEMVKVLREATGVSIMQCRKALEETNGDIEKAKIILQKKSAEAASKKTDRTFGAGVVASYIHSNGTVGAMIELVSETDFVSRNEEFKALARDIAMHITASNPRFLRKEDITAEDTEKIQDVLKDEVKGKPAELVEKIMTGKLAAYFGERTLLDQPFIKNPEVTVNQLIETAVQKFGEKIEVARFVRFGVLER